MQGMDELFKLISQKLGVALSIVQQHGMEYILQYGHYDFITSIPKFLFIGILTLLITLLLRFVYYTTKSEIYDIDFNDYINDLKSSKIFILICILAFFTPLIIHCINYYASPEIYSIKVVWKLLH